MLAKYNGNGKPSAGLSGVICWRFYRSPDDRFHCGIARPSDADRLARFEQEAPTIAALSHPILLAIFDVATGDSPYLITELLDGVMLCTRLERGPLGHGDAIALGLQIAAGLTEPTPADRAPDSKPDSIFVTVDGRAKILDFALATTGAVDTAEHSITTARTVPGMLLGAVACI